MIKKILLGLSFTCLTSMACADVISMEKHLKTTHPDMPVKNIQPTEVKGIYIAEVDRQPIYLTEDARYFFVGNLIRVSDLKNLTRDHSAEMQKIDWKSLPFKDALKKVKGNGKRKLVVFSDPNCPYCQRLEQELQKLNNVTIYTFVLAFKSESLTPSRQIYCEKNPVQAWEDLILNKVQPKNSKTCANPVERNLALAKQLGINGTPTLVLENGYKLVGGYSADQVEKLWSEMK